MSLVCNIDHADDAEFFAVTEGLAIAGTAQDERCPRTLLVVSVSIDGACDAVLAGRADEQTLRRLQAAFDELEIQSRGEAPNEPVVLHLLEQGTE